MLVVGAAILHRSENAVHRLRASASLERLLRCCVLLESAMVREGLLESATVMECALHRGRSQQVSGKRSPHQVWRVTLYALRFFGGMEFA